MRKYRRMSRLRIIQGQGPAVAELKKKHGDGSVILTPSEAKVADFAEPFLYVPLFMFTEFVHWSDRKDKDTKGILDRTQDETHILAVKARDRNRRFEKYKTRTIKNSEGNEETQVIPDEEGKWTSRYVEALCFPGIIYSGALSGTPCVMSFDRGEFMTGVSFSEQILLRKAGDDPAPHWTQVWQFCAGEHSSPEWTWRGFDFSVPDPEVGLPFINEEHAEDFEKLATEIEQKWAKEQLIVDRSDSDEPVEDAVFKPVLDEELVEEM